MARGPGKRVGLLRRGRRVRHTGTRNDGIVCSLPSSVRRRYERSFATRLYAPSHATHSLPGPAPWSPIARQRDFRISDFGRGWSVAGHRGSRTRAGRRARVAEVCPRPSREPRRLRRHTIPKFREHSADAADVPAAARTLDDRPRGLQLVGDGRSDRTAFACAQRPVRYNFFARSAGSSVRRR